MFLPDQQRLAWLWRPAAASVLVLLTACAGSPRPDKARTAADADTANTRGGVSASGDMAHAAEADDAPVPPPVVQATAPFPWSHKTFPGKKLTHYASVRIDGRDAIGSDADSAASMLRQPLRIEPADLEKIAFSWKVAGLIKGADLTQRDADDSPVRIALVFDGDRSRFSPKNALLSELAHALTGEPLPYATLMYVWGNRMPPGSVVINPRTDRIRKLVLESGTAQVGRWLDYERDIRADYEKVFGEAPGALVGIGIMTDSDNTKQHAQAWYGPVTFKGKTAALSGVTAARP